LEGEAMVDQMKSILAAEELAGHILEFRQISKVQPDSFADFYEDPSFPAKVFSALEHRLASEIEKRIRTPKRIRSPRIRRSDSK